MPIPQAETRGGPRLKVRADDRRGAKKGTTTMDFSGQGAGGSIGQAPFVPTEAQAFEVRTLARILTIEQVADELGISVNTIYRHYHKDFKAGRREVTKAVSSKLITQAMNGDKTAMIFYLKTQGGWNSKLLIGGIPGAPIVTANFDISAYLADKSEAEIDVLIPLLEQLYSATNDGVEGSATLGD